MGTWVAVEKLKSPVQQSYVIQQHLASYEFNMASELELWLKEKIYELIWFLSTRYVTVVEIHHQLIKVYGYWVMSH